MSRFLCVSCVDSNSQLNCGPLSVVTNYSQQKIITTMKGKGKKERDTEDDCPLMFIDFNSANLKDFPRLWGLLNRRDEQNVGIEDLDGLQLEIEAILTTVITRKLQLENEMESLVNWQESKAKDKKPTAKVMYDQYVNHHSFIVMVESLTNIYCLILFKL